MAKKNISFSIEEGIWERCQKVKKESNIKVNWSSIVEECLSDSLKEIESYDKDFVDILTKPTISLSDIKKVRFLTITKLKEGIEQQNKKFTNNVESVLKDIVEVLQHLEKRQEQIISSNQQEIEKPKNN